MTTIKEALGQIVFCNASKAANAAGLASPSVGVAISDAWLSDMERQAMLEVWPAYAGVESRVPPVHRAEGNSRFHDMIGTLLSTARRALYHWIVSHPGKPVPQMVAFQFPSYVGTGIIDAVMVIDRPPGFRVNQWGSGPEAQSILIARRSEIAADTRITAESADDPLTVAWLAIHTAAHV